MYTTPHAHITTCTIMHTTQYVYSATCIKCTQNHMYIALHIQHLHNIICTQHHISNMHKEPYMHNDAYTSCAQYNMCIALHIRHLHAHNITCTKIVLHIQNHTVFTKKSCFQCLIHAFPNMSQTILLSFRCCIPWYKLSIT